MQFGTEKTTMAWLPDGEDMFIHADTIHERDGQTDGQYVHLSASRVSVDRSLPPAQSPPQGGTPSPPQGLKGDTHPKDPVVLYNEI